MLVQIFRGSGQRSLLIYVVYGLAGARWEQQKKNETLKMLKEVQKDAAMRGDVAAIICGDLKVEPTTVQEFMAEMKTGWNDAAHWGTDGFDESPTCTKGKGSGIDWALMNRAVSVMLKAYDVQKGFKEQKSSFREAYTGYADCRADLQHAQNSGLTREIIPSQARIMCRLR